MGLYCSVKYLGLQYRFGENLYMLSLEPQGRRIHQGRIQRRKIEFWKYQHLGSGQRPLKDLKGEKEMATHSSILAWKSPWTEEPGGLQSMGLHGWACVHEGGGRWIGSNKLVELKKEKKGLKGIRFSVPLPGIKSASPILEGQDHQGSPRRHVFLKRLL